MTTLTLGEGPVDVCPANALGMQSKELPCPLAVHPFPRPLPEYGSLSSQSGTQGENGCRWLLDVDDWEVLQDVVPLQVTMSAEDLVLGKPHQIPAPHMAVPDSVGGM